MVRISAACLSWMRQRTHPTSSSFARVAPFLVRDDARGVPWQMFCVACRPAVGSAASALTPSLSRPGPLSSGWPWLADFGLDVKHEQLRRPLAVAAGVLVGRLMSRNWSSGSSAWAARVGSRRWASGRAAPSGWDFGRPICLSMDLDGTVANISARLALAEQVCVEGTPEYWDVALNGDLYELDVPIPEAKSFLHAWLRSGADVAGDGFFEPVAEWNTGTDHSQRHLSSSSRCVAYVSGRRSGTEHQTRAWLQRHGFPAGEILHRPTGSKSMGWKCQQLRGLSRRFHVVAHFGDREDDREAAWRAQVRFVWVWENQWISSEEAKLQQVEDIFDVITAAGDAAVLAVRSSGGAAPLLVRQRVGGTASDASAVGASEGGTPITSPRTRWQ